jgi:peptide/nickel transport system permease protein
MSYLRNRLLQAVVTLFGVVTLGFFLLRMMPGDAESYLRQNVRRNPESFGLPPNPTPQQVDRVVTEYLNMPEDAPLWQEYITFVANAAGGDLGQSIIVEPGVSNMQLILEVAPWTIFLSSVSLVYGLVVGILLGTVMAYYEGSKFDVGATVSVLVSGAIPYYVVAIVLLYFLGFVLGWFPTGGRFDPDTTPGMNLPFIIGVLDHATLPVLSFIITGLGGGALAMRANSIRIMGADYIRVAELRGLSTYTITTRYLGRNAILPMYTTILLGLGALLSGSVIIEAIFAYEGMGLLMFEAVIKRDFPLLTAAMIITSFLFILGTLLADFTYALIDPRAEQKSMG